MQEKHDQAIYLTPETRSPHATKGEKMKKFSLISSIITIMLFLTACPSTTAPSLDLSPTSASVTVGDATATTFTATLKNASSDINWELVGEGSLDKTTGETVSYTPPATGDASTATLNVTAGTLTKAATISIAAKPVTTDPSFDISLDKTALSIGQGSSDTVVVTLTPKDGFDENVTLSVTGLPSGVSETYSANPSKTGSTLTINATEAATEGTAAVIIEAKSGSVSKTASLNLSIVAGLPIIESVSSSIFGGSPSKQLPQGFGEVTINVTGKRLTGTTAAKLGDLVATSATAASDTEATLVFNITGVTPSALALEIDATAGKGTRANAIEATAWTVQPTAKGGLVLGTPDHPYTSLTAALAKVSANETVTIADGTYNAASGETFPITVPAGVTVTGASQAGTIIDGTTTADGLVFAGSATVSELSISKAGRALYVATATTGDISLTNVTTTDGRDGLVANGAVKLTVTDSTFTKGTASGMAIFETVQLTATNVISSENGSSGLYSASSGKVTLTNTDILNNVAFGIRAGSEADLTITGGKVNNNGTRADVDLNLGLQIAGTSVVSVDGTTFDKNGLGNGTAGTETDGIRVLGTAQLTLKNVTISGSGLDGLGICCDAPTVTVENTTIKDNAEDGVNIFGGTFTMTGGTVSGNAANGILNEIETGDTSTVTLTGVTVTDSVDSVHVELTGTATSTVNINGGSFTGASDNAIELLAPDTATLNTVVKKNNADDSRVIMSSTDVELGDSRVFYYRGGNVSVRDTTITSVSDQGVTISATSSPSAIIDFGSAASSGNNIVQGATLIQFWDNRPATTAIITAVGTQLGPDAANTCGTGTITGPVGTTGTVLLRIETAGNKVQCSLP